jgi:hypothetical protein
VEARFKVIQLSHTVRAQHLERLLEKSKESSYPQIFRSFAEAAGANRQSRRWRRVMSWPHVAFPHALFILIACGGGIWAAVAG